MNKITALNVFRRVVEMGTFRAAADDLRLSRRRSARTSTSWKAFLGMR